MFDHPFDALMTGDDIYRNFTEGPGGGDLRTGAEIVRQIAGKQHEQAEAIRALAVKMESAWQGEASGAAQRGAVPLAVDHEMMAPRVGTTQDLVSRQVGSFDTARNQVVPVPPQPELPGWPSPGAVVAGLPTYEQQLSTHNGANQTNVDVMSAYEGASQYNTDNLPADYGDVTPDSAPVTIGQPSAGAAGGTVPAGDTSYPSSPEMPPPGGGSDTATTGGRSTNTGASAPIRPSMPHIVGTGDQVAPQSTPGQATTATPGSGGEIEPPVRTGTSDPGAGNLRSLAPGSGRSANADSGDGRGVRGYGRGTGGGLPEAGAGRLGDGGERGVGARTGGQPMSAGSAAAAEEVAASRSAAAGRGAGTPISMAGGRGQRGEDDDHQRPSFLIEDDPEDVFGTDEVTAPSVIE